MSKETAGAENTEIKVGASTEAEKTAELPEKSISGETPEDEGEEFTYDDDGNIIIPDDEEDPNEAASEPSEEKPAGNQDAAQTADDAPEVKPEGAVVPDGRDARIAELERKIRLYEHQGRDTLKKLGIQSDDVLGGLAQAAAEADNTDLAEYVARRDRDFAADEIIAQNKKITFEEKMKRDLAAIQAEYPETKKYSKMTDLPNIERIGTLIDRGLTPAEAYIAVNRGAVRAGDLAAGRRAAEDTKAHLKSNVPVGAKNTATTISKAELYRWRDMFPGKTDKELMKLYKETL